MNSADSAARSPIEEPPVRRVRWPEAHRIVPSRYPPVQLFERLSPDPGEWETLAEIESLTNPRIRDEIGEIHLVPVEERVSGPGASWVMAPFAQRKACRRPSAIVETPVTKFRSFKPFKSVQTF